MSKHTPGPWRSEPCYRSGYTVWGGTDAVPVCVVDTQDDEGRFGTIKNEADARLIAAAPELLEALKELTGHTNERFTGGVWDRARAAIKQAEENT